MKIVFKSGIVIAVLAVGVWSVLGLLRSSVVVAPAENGVAVDAVPGTVTVLAERTMELRSDVRGRILMSNLELGAHVSKGAVLLQLDPTDVKIEIEKIESDLEAARERSALGSPAVFDLQNARADLENMRRLAAGGNISQSEVEKQERLVQQIEQKIALDEVNSRQAVAGLENLLRVKRRELEKMTVRSPAAGVVSAIHAQTGDLIDSNFNIATIVAQSRVIEGRISEENFAGIEVGQSAIVRFLGYGGEQFPATVSKVLPTADPATQRYIVHLDVDVDPGRIAPGSTGEVSIVRGRREGAVIIPRRALFGDNVFVVRGNRVELVRVQRGFISLNHVEILEGVSEGDLVIVEELERYRNGDRVRIRTAET